MFTLAAVNALLFIYTDLKEGFFAEKSQKRSHRTNGIAVKSSAFEGQEDKQQQIKSRKGKGDRGKMRIFCLK